MTRTNVYSYPNENDFDAMQDGPILAGHFDPDKAEMFREDTRWNGNNNVSVHTRDQFDHQILYRTAGGRWVLNNWSQWQGRPSTYEFISDEQAKQWLTINNDDDAIERFFGPLEEEVGPAPVGRPAIGKPFPMRLEPDVLAEVDRRAQEKSVSRTEMIRRLVGAALDYAIPAEPDGVTHVHDFGGVTWAREPGRGGLWSADLDLAPMPWTLLVYERGPLSRVVG